MGYIRHHAIVITAAFGTDAVRAHEKARELGARVTEIVESDINSYYSFMVVPDGSKEGWDTSQRGDGARLGFTAWLNAQRYTDGSTPLDWVEVQYGDDEGETKIIRHSDEVR